jgi:cell division septation protein DedD
VRGWRVPLTSHLLLLTLGCAATTSRPYYPPLPTAALAEIELEIPEATRVLAEAMARDSIALSFIREADGFIDSGWLDAGTLERTGARPLGDKVVRVRAWINPAKQFWSELRVEATFRPMEDPSRPERELDAQLPDDHPLQRKLAGIVRKLIEEYGDPESLKALEAPTPAIKPDSAIKADSAVKPDSAARPDTGKVIPDTTSIQADTVAARVFAQSIATGKPAAGFYVQVAAVKTEAAAVTDITRIKQAGYAAVTVPEGGFLKIRAGPFPTRARADEVAADLARKLGERPFVVRVP